MAVADLGKLNILIAYPYFSETNIRILEEAGREIPIRLIIDSGAFTAWNTGREITLSGYCEFLDRVLPRLSHLELEYVQLDVFNEPERTYDQLHQMLRSGYTPMPVFTRGDTLERLDEYYSLHDYLMFGGITIGGKNQNYVKWFMENNHNRKVHWLGFTRQDFLYVYRPTSCDSSSIASEHRFGNIAIFDRQKLALSTYHYKQDRQALRTAVLDLYETYLSQILSPAEIYDLLQQWDIVNGVGIEYGTHRRTRGRRTQSTSDISGLLVFHYFSYVLYQQYLQKAGISNYYLAVATEYRLQRLITCYRLLHQLVQEG